MVCPAGGLYSLTPQCMGTCSLHGRSHFLTPICEVPVKTVSQSEANSYTEFVNEYNQYWRTYFDPIAIRVQVLPQKLRVETIVLPLIDNSIYTNLAKVFGGATEPLDALPVPSRNILSAAFKWNKGELLKTLSKNGVPLEFFLISASTDKSTLNSREFFASGLGNQIAFHVYDATPTFDLNVPVVLAQSMRSIGGSTSVRSEGLFAAFLIGSLNTPVYISAPVQNTKVVDDFLDALDEVLVTQAHKVDSGGWFRVTEDAYTSDVTAKASFKIHSHTFGVEGVKWRVCWARIGSGLYVASKPFILDDIAALEANPAPAPAEAGPTGHAMVRVRAQNWHDTLPDFRLGWAENNRHACLNNLSPLSDLSRAFAASGDLPAARDAFVADQARTLYGARLFCPEGGAYVVSADGKTVTCSKHGSMLTPRQPLAPDETSPAGKAISTFGGMTATLTFMEDGLHAVVTVERKP